MLLQSLFIVRVDKWFQGFAIPSPFDNGSEEFLAAWKEKFGCKDNREYESEAAIFATHGLSYIEPYLRENPTIIAKAAAKDIPTVIQVSDIKGIIHSHSNWSDGVHTIQQMAEGAIAKGLE